MEIDLFAMLIAACAGFFAAALGAQIAFILTGLAYLLGLAGALSGNPDYISIMAFGPVFGPHVSFAAGATAAAYAGSRGYLDSPKDIVTPLAKLGRLDVLLVGAAAGVVGYLAQILVAAIPYVGSRTDSIAVVVIVLGVLSRWIFGRSRVLGPWPAGKWFSTDDAQWVPWQQRIPVSIGYGVFVGGLFAGASLYLVTEFPDAVALWAHPIGWGYAAITLIFLTAGFQTPVTHHIAIVASLGAIRFLPLVGGELVWALLIGAAWGALAAILAEILARLTQNRGNTHIDPPAFAIFPLTFAINAIAL